jgi:hypothetical protein
MVTSQIERRPDGIGDRQAAKRLYLVGAEAIHPDRQPRLAAALSDQDLDELIVVHPVRSM